MRIIFMGSPEFAVPSLNALVEAGTGKVTLADFPPPMLGDSEPKPAVRQPLVQSLNSSRGDDVKGTSCPTAGTPREAAE